MTMNNKLLRLLMLICISTSLTLSSCTKNPSETIKKKSTEEYCIVKQLVHQDKFYLEGATLSKEEFEKFHNLKTISEALNFMNQNGWELVCAYEYNVQKYNDYNFHYIMKRKI